MNYTWQGMLQGIEKMLCTCSVLVLPGPSVSLLKWLSSGGGGWGYTEVSQAAKYKNELFRPKLNICSG